MADTTYTNQATQRRATNNIIAGKGDALNLKSLCATVELAASASGVTTRLGTIPSNARITLASRIYNDDLATSGSPTLDLGLGSVNSNITTDPDALTNGVALSSAGSDVLAIAIADGGKKAFEFVSGQTDDPKGELDVFFTVKDAATTDAGTVTVDLYYYVD